MKKVVTGNIENLIETKVNTSRGRARKHKIEWTELTWNPSVGCTKISSGCKNCYAKTMAKRLQAIGMKGYENGFKFNLDRIFEVIENTPHHTYQILTKRADRMYDYFSKNLVPSNVWLGVTVENKQQGLPRIDKLRHLKATVLFLSVEPLLEDLGKINLENIDWVIVGGESGNRARPMEKQWVLNIKQQCEAENIPFFFKQWGTWGEDKIKRNKKVNGKELDGKVWQQYPKIIE